VRGIVLQYDDRAGSGFISGDIPQNVDFAILIGTLQASHDANGVDYVTHSSTAQQSSADVAEIDRAATCSRLSGVPTSDGSLQPS